MTKSRSRDTQQSGPHPVGEGAAIWFHAVLALVFVAEFVLGLYTLPASFALGVAFLALSPLGIWFHAVGAVRHWQDWRDEDDEPAFAWGFVAPDPEEPDLTPFTETPRFKRK